MNTDDIANYTVIEKLRTSGRNNPCDKVRGQGTLREAFKGLEAGSIYMRFFGPRKELTDRELYKPRKWNLSGPSPLSRVSRKAQGNGSSAAGDASSWKDRTRQLRGGCLCGRGGLSRPGAVASFLLKHLLLIGRQQSISQLKADSAPSCEQKDAQGL